MMDLTQLASESVALIAPLLPAVSHAAGKVADHVADRLLSQPGAKLFDWMMERFQGKPAAAVLDRAIAEPENPDRLESLRIEILEVAEKDAWFREQLAGLVADGVKERVQATTQTASPGGHGNKIVQAAGKDIDIRIS